MGTRMAAGARARQPDTQSTEQKNIENKKNFKNFQKTLAIQLNLC